MKPKVMIRLFLRPMDSHYHISIVHVCFHSSIGSLAYSTTHHR